MKGTDAVLVHPKWHTVHEVRADGTTRCGNPLGQIDYKPMTRDQAQGIADAHPCRSQACEPHGRRRGHD